MVAIWTTVTAASILTADISRLSSNVVCTSLQEFVLATRRKIIGAVLIAGTHNLIAASVGCVTSALLHRRRLRLGIVTGSWACVDLTQTITACCCVIACDLVGTVFQDFACATNYIFSAVRVATALARDVSLTANVGSGANRQLRIRYKMEA